MDILQDYSSDSDIDSDTECSNLSNQQQEDKLPLLPPGLLDKFHIEPSTKKRKVEDMNNRVWTSFIYLDWRLTSRDRNTLSQYLTLCNSKFKAFGVDFQPMFHSEFGTPMNLHLSLSPNLMFPTETIRDKFFSLLQDKFLEKPGWTDRTVPLLRTPILVKSPRVETTFLTLPVSPQALDEYIRPLFSDIITLFTSEQLSIEHSISQNFIDKAHVTIAKTYSPQMPPNLLPPVLTTTLAIPCDHRVQYDRNRESLTLTLPNPERV